MNHQMPDNANDVHYTVGTALMAYSVVGISLGLTMIALDVGHGAFLDGPRAGALGVITFAVGAWIRYDQAAKP